MSKPRLNDGTGYYRCSNCRKVENWATGDGVDYWCVHCDAITPKAEAAASSTPPMEDWQPKWNRLAKYARHPRTVPEGEIEIQANLIVAIDDQCRLMAKEIERLRSTVDILCSPPMTIEEAEAIVDELPELSEAERAAMGEIDIQKIIKAATDPDNATAEWMLFNLLDAAEACPGFDPETLAKARSWRKRSLCL